MLTSLTGRHPSATVASASSPSNPTAARSGAPRNEVAARSNAAGVVPSASGDAGGQRVRVPGGYVVFGSADASRFVAQPDVPVSYFFGTDAARLEPVAAVPAQDIRPRLAEPPQPQPHASAEPAAGRVTHKRPRHHAPHENPRLLQTDCGMFELLMAIEIDKGRTRLAQATGGHPLHPAGNATG